MFDEKLLERALPRPAQDAPAPALDGIMHLAQSARYEEAAERAGELLEGGCKDVRAFVVYALGVFAERGPGAVPALFGAIARVLPTGAPGSGPPSPELRMADTALRFCFRIMKAHLEFDERKTGAARQSWSQHFETSAAPSVLRACADLRKAIHEAIEAPRCDTELGSVTAHLEAYCSRFAPDVRTLPRALSPEPEAPACSPVIEDSVAPAAAPVDESTGCDGLVEFAPLAPSVPPAFSRRATDYPPDVPTMSVSPALQQFMRKLAAFEHLVDRGDVAKAAIVAHDIRQVVADFDPKIYLPNLLSPHFRLLSSSVEQLAPYWDRGTTPGWEALEQLYRVDLDAFIEA
jgi:hypothetical protein